MELMTKLIVNPLLWMVYITLPLLTGPLSSPPFFRRYARLLCIVIVCLIIAEIYVCYLVRRTFLHILVSNHIFILIFHLGRTFMIIWHSSLSADHVSTSCMSYTSIFVWAKATTFLYIFGLKNRRACQLLSALAAMVVGLTKAKIFAAIPVSIGMLLTIPDLEPDPWIEFRVRFAAFLAAHMDEESLQALLDSKFSKMLSCNEMMPSLPGHIQSSARAWFRLDGSAAQPEIFYDSNVELEDLEEGIISSQQEIGYDSIVEREYRIGLGSITTSVRQDQIHVGVHTPFSGVKNRSIKNTPRSRYNLDKSARFWRENPGVGIWNKEKLLAMDPAAVKVYCVSVDDWIKFCGSDDYIFEELDADWTWNKHCEENSTSNQESTCLEPVH